MKQENAEVFGYIARAECHGLLEDAGALARRQIEFLAVRVVPVLERLERLVVDLRRGHDPQHQAAPALPEVRVDEIDHPRREQRFAATGRDLEAEGGKPVAESVAAWVVGPPGHSPAPRPLHPVEPPFGILASRRPVLNPPLREPFKEAADRRQRPLLVFLQDHCSRLLIALWI